MNTSTSYHLGTFKTNVVFTDNDTKFASKEFEDFLRQNGIHRIRTEPNHPASNGVTERAVQTLKEGMKKMNGGNV